MSLDQGILQAALVGYQHQLAEIQEKMAELRRQIGGAAPKTTAAAKNGRPRKHRMSAEGRARIAAAQRARWAKVHKAAKRTMTVGTAA